MRVGWGFHIYSSKGGSHGSVGHQYCRCVDCGARPRHSRRHSRSLVDYPPGSSAVGGVTLHHTNRRATSSPSLKGGAPVPFKFP